MIHGADGAKLSKRHGALGTNDYQKVGFLPEAMENYLLRLGWAHGDDEIITRDQAIKWFGADGLGKSPARFDTDKLTHINAHYLRQKANRELVELVKPFMTEHMTEVAEKRIELGMDGLKQRAKTLVELADSASVYIGLPSEYTEKAQKLMTEPNRVLVAELRDLLRAHNDWTADSLQAFSRDFAEHRQIGLGKVAQPLRVCLTGSTVSPGIFDVMEILGREECFSRLNVSLVRKH